MPSRAPSRRRNLPRTESLFIRARAAKRKAGPHDWPSEPGTWCACPTVFARRQCRSVDLTPWRAATRGYALPRCAASAQTWRYSRDWPGAKKPFLRHGLNSPSVGWRKILKSRERNCCILTCIHSTVLPEEIMPSFPHTMVIWLRHTFARSNNRPWLERGAAVVWLTLAVLAYHYGARLGTGQRPITTKRGHTSRWGMCRSRKASRWPKVRLCAPNGSEGS